MEKLKFSILSISILLSFGLFASEQETTSLYDNAKKEILEADNASKSQERSQLRNKENLYILRNAILDEDISSAEKELKLKKLKFKLENIPPEYLDNTEAYLEKEYFNPKKESLYPTIATGSNVGRDSFPVETYSIDQQLLIPQLEAIKKEKEDKKDFISFSNVIKNESMPEVAPISIPNPDPIITPIIPKKIDENKISVEEELDKLGLTSAELAKINASLNQSNSKIDTKSDTLKNIEPEIKTYSEVKSATIKEVFIFGEDKSADLIISIYVGDGVDGEEYNDTLENIKENQVISIKGYSYKIDSISFSEVVIKSLKNNETYVASKSLRNL